MTPFSSSSVARFTSALMSSYDAPFFRRTVRSTTDTSAVGTRKAMPVSRPFSDGITLPTALAAPVLDGMMLKQAPRPPRQSLADGPSTVCCVAVTACTVVMRPSMMPYLSWIVLASGARQLVVHDAFDTMAWSEVYSWWFTPMTYMGASGDGALITTRRAPPSMCAWASAVLVNLPVASTTYSASHERSDGLMALVTAISLPLTVRLPSDEDVLPSHLPCTVSYLNMYSM
mmetsp:Transcript_148989/g.361768  ORF Transcript_148989/g.361768 Transcript_148989/m.361768 type:complete len:230 (-) Transcript_148989:955-1644(-)